jgi:hypothetical protein
MTRTFRQYAWLPTVSLAAVLIAACGGGAGGQGPKSLSLSAVANQSINQDTVIGPLRVTISGVSMLDQVTLTASSTNSTVIPDANITVSGQGAERMLSIVPLADAIGSAQINIQARDAAGHASTQYFLVDVRPVFIAFTPSATTAFNASEDATPVAVSGVTFGDEADGNPDAFTSLLQ